MGFLDDVGGSGMSREIDVIGLTYVDGLSA